MQKFYEVAVRVLDAIAGRLDAAANTLADTSECFAAKAQGSWIEYEYPEFTTYEASTDQDGLRRTYRNAINCETNAKRVRLFLDHQLVNEFSFRTNL